MQTGLPTFSPPSNETSQFLVYHLAHSLSPSAQEREAALAWLQACQAEPGFQHCLVEVVAARELGKEVRTQAVLYFKNCLDKYWKSVGKHVLNPQEKHTVREKLLSLLDEEDSAIAKTLAFCVGRIARKDYPKEWPDLFDRLLSAMQHAHESIEQGHAQARIVLHRALLFFQQAVKALSENRTIAGKNVIGRLCEQAFVNLSHFYQHVFHRALQGISSNHNSLPTPSADGTPSDLDLSLLILKILSKLVVYGWGGAGETPQRKEEFTNLQVSFFISSMQDFTTIYQARQAIIVNPSNEASLVQQAQSMSSPLITLNKSTLAYGKMYMALLFQNHIVFHKLGQTPQLVQLYWSFVQQASQTLRSTDLDNPASLFPLKFIMQSLLFVKHCFTQFPYKNSELESQTFATECTECILLRLLPLRQADLDKWQEDPEEFIKDEEDEKWKFDIRPCAEAFLKELIREYEHTVFQISEYRERYQNASTFEDLLIKEAIYAAISHCSSELTKARYPDGRQLLPYLEWLSGTLLQEAMSTDQTGIIVRRRIAPIASAFIAEYPAAEAQSLAYQVIIHLLQRNASTDLAVRMTAAKALGSCDAWDLDLEPLLPYLETAFVELGDILQQVDLPESKMLLNDILGTLIVRVDRKIQPHLERLMEIILQLWASASDDPSKQAIVATFKKLVDALGTSSPVLHTLIRQLVQESCDPNSPSHVLLQDDGLELWRSALRFTAEPTGDLIALAPLSVQLLSQGSDILRKVLRLIQSYIVLQPDYLTEQSQPIFLATANLLQSLSHEATKPLLYTVDMVVQSTPASIWAPAMLHSGLFHHIVKTIATDPANPSVTRFLPTLGRLAISDGAAFTELLRQSAIQLQVSYDNLAQLILQKWLDRYDNLTYPAQRKLVALGLTSSVQTTSHAVLDKIDEIIGAWLSALGETEESASGEYVANISGEQQGAPSDIDEWQDPQQIPPALSSHPALLDTTGAEAYQHPSASPTISLSSAAEPSFSFISEASSSRSSSLCTTATNDSFSLARDTTIVQDDTQAETIGTTWRDSAMNAGRLSSHGPDGHLACDTPWPAIADKQFSSLSSPLHNSSDRWNDHTTPTTPQSSTFYGNSTFADYDPNYNYSTHAGRDDDDNDSTGYTRFDNSAQCYYNSDEHDEEAHLELGWEVAADAWGASPEAIVPEDSRLKALAARDPLHTLKLTNVISSALNNTAEMNGGMQVFHANYLAPPKVDAAVLEEFQQWLSGLARGGD